MEANVPEKLYVDTEDRLSDSVFYGFTERKDSDIEYIRTDAFIDKACDWLKNHNDYIDVKDGNITYFDMEKCVEDFKKAMEHE